MRAMIRAVLAAGMSFVAAPPSAWPHAFLDHASPAVGSAMPTAPAAVTIWFTQDIEPAFSSMTVTDQAGRRADRGDAHVAPGHQDELQVGLQALLPGTYTVSWHVVSVDTHTTEGSFTFTVGR